MHNYEVVFVEMPFVKKKNMFDSHSGNPDSLTFSKEIEALLIEKDKLGYEMVSMVPINGNIAPMEKLIVTTGFVITFKKATASKA